ncbi:MAG TPA: class I SAM-dependent methyltransferase, partial [Candidatus Acidoferrum sp.]|nr:class I SAM-dependent methyltransferase [Candidatus Acidoferrum sp.]
HTALDPFQSSVWADAGILAVERASLSGFLDFRSSLSSLELPLMLKKQDRIDFVYIDGSHLFEDVFLDFYFVSRILSEKGVILFDDSSLPHVHKVLKFIKNNLKSSFVEVDLGKYRSDGGKSIRYQVARVLGKRQLTAFRRIGSPTREWNAPFFDF